MPPVRTRTLSPLLVALILSWPGLGRAVSQGQAADDRGAELFRAGDYAGARDAFREAVRLDPRHVRAWENLGWAELKLGNMEEALRIWNDLLRIEPGRRETLHAIESVTRPRPSRRHRSAVAAANARGEEAVRNEDWAAAEAAWREVLSLGRREPRIRFQLGYAQLARKETGTAERTFASLLATPRLQPTWAPRVAEAFIERDEVERGRAFFAGPHVPDTVPGKRTALANFTAHEAARAAQAGQLEKAVELFAQALALDPRNRRALRDLGWAWRNAGRLDQAERTWRRYAGAHPELADPHAALALLYLDRRQYARALREARASRAIDHDSIPGALREIRALLGLARTTEALRLADTLAKRHPRDPSVQRLLAEALTRGRQYQPAVAQWRRVLDLDPKSGMAQQAWIRALVDAGEFDRALSEAAVQAEDPAAPAGIIELLADDAMARKDHANAARWYGTLTLRFPDRVNYWRYRMAALQRSGRAEERVAVAREALRRMPERFELQYELVTALTDAGQIPEALDRADTLVRTFRDSADARHALVRLLERDGQLVEALAAVRDSSQLYKDYERRLVEARLMARTNDVPGAIATVEEIVEPHIDTRYVPVLLYHGVVDQPRTTQTATSRFDEHMAALAAHGYQAITVTELLAMMEQRSPFPVRPILVTFDDGRTDSLSNGDPILAKYGFKATIFVLSGRAGAEDGLQAGWPTLAGYAGTGRWDVQAHGHDAHDPIVIDRRGATGEFLSYFAWRPADQRSETFAEYCDRIEADYVRTKSDIEQRLESHHVMAFAYPMSVVGLAQPGGQHTVPPINEQVASRHFRFGFVQDASGYNDVRLNAATPFLLRRFEVPSDWTGPELIAHLEQHEPRRLARLQLAKLVAADGRPEAARRVIAPLGLQPPPRDPDIRHALAYIAWLQDRPHEAAGHLADAPSTPSAQGEDELFERRVAWRTDPRVGARSAVFADSADLTVATLEGVARFQVAAPVELELSAGAIHLDERGLTAISGQQVALASFFTAGRHWDGSAWGRYRALSQDLSTVNGGAAVRYRHEHHAMELQWTYDDVETVRAVLRDIRKHTGTATYEYQSLDWRAAALFSHSEYGDANRRDVASLTALRLFGEEQRWGLGASIRYDDTGFLAPEYYSPRNLLQLLGRARFAYSWRDSSELLLDASAGAGRDDVSDWRITGRVRAEVGRWWGTSGRLRTALVAEGQALPDYSSLIGALRIDWRL